MMANIVAMFHSALHMDDGYVNHIAIVQDVDGYHNHFLYDEDKGKGAAGTGPFKTIEDAKQDVIAHYPDAKENLPGRVQVLQHTASNHAGRIPEAKK